MTLAIRAIDPVAEPTQEQASLQARVYSALEELPAAYMRLFEEAGRQSFFLTLPWFRNFAKTALDEGCALRIYGIGPKDGLGPAAGMLVACSLPQLQNMTSLRKLSALTNYYSCFFAPHLAAPGGRIRETLHELARTISAERPRWDAVEIQPLDVNSEGFSALVEGFKAAGFVVQTFFCFGNWYLAVNGRSFAQYVESLPSVLKNTLQRKQRKLEKSGRANIEIITGGEDLEAAIQAYTKVFRASWKRPEPYPDFIPGLIRMCSEMGVLRLGLVYVDGEAAAAQLWIVHGGVAFIYKLAYDERFGDLSVGTILTARLMQHVLNVDKVDEVDYLSGDDSYKKDWMSHRRERWGILAMNPRTTRGALAICRHLGGRSMKRALSWISRRLRPGDKAGDARSTAAYRQTGVSHPSSAARVVADSASGSAADGTLKSELRRDFHCRDVIA